MKRYLFLLSAILLTAAAGCVDINDARVQVSAPGQVDPYSRIVLDKCTPVVYPHRLIQATTGSASPLALAGPQMVYNQADFDKYWGYVTALANDNISTSALSQEPLVNWDQQIAYFLVIGAGNSCEKTRPFGNEMMTDCYTISISLYRYQEGTNCQPPTTFSVFIYLFPKTNLPVNYVWVNPTPIPTQTPKPTLTPTPTATPTPVPESEEE